MTFLASKSPPEQNAKKVPVTEYQRSVIWKKDIEILRGRMP